MVSGYEAFSIFARTICAASRLEDRRYVMAQETFRVSLPTISDFDFDFRDFSNF